MGHDADEFETRLSRCERALFGDDDSSEGLSARMHMTETMLAKIDATLSKLAWLVIAAVLVGLLNLVIGKPGATAPHQSTSVITGDAQSGPALLDAATATGTAQSHRDYLTTADVAAKENVSVREVVDMIAQGEITPPPQKQGREYRITADYRLQPHPAAECGEQPQ
jgi:hypothetical protein